MTPEEIKKINDDWRKGGWDSWDQGIFTEPSWIPSHIKEPVIYMRWIASGMSGGSCWGDEAKDFYNDRSEKLAFGVLDYVLKKLKPDLTYLQYREIERTLVHTNTETSWQYYGNCDNYEVTYVILRELEEYLENLNVV